MYSCENQKSPWPGNLSASPKLWRPLLASPPSQPADYKNIVYNEPVPLTGAGRVGNCDRPPPTAPPDVKTRFAKSDVLAKTVSAYISQHHQGHPADRSSVGHQPQTGRMTDRMDTCLPVRCVIYPPSRECDRVT